MSVDQSQPLSKFDKPKSADALRGLGVVYGGPIAIGAWWLGSAAAAIKTAKPPARGRMATAAQVFVGAGLVAPWIYYAALRRRMLFWGATSEEIVKALPGDDLVTNPTYSETRALSIAAPPEEVWPWLIQVGFRRGGWYSYDVLEAAAGAGDFLEGHSATSIHPELQPVVPGDVILMSPWTGYEVVEVQPARALVLGSTGFADAMMPKSTWVFVLEPTGAGTRLIVRGRSQPNPLDAVGWSFNHLIEAPHFIMERRMLLGLKQRAEHSARMALRNRTVGQESPSAGSAAAV